MGNNWSKSCRCGCSVPYIILQAKPSSFRCSNDQCIAHYVVIASIKQPSSCGAILKPCRKFNYGLRPNNSYHQTIFVYTKLPLSGKLLHIHCKLTISAPDKTAHMYLDVRFRRMRCSLVVSTPATKIVVSGRHNPSTYSSPNFWASVTTCIWKFVNG
jgi:hypothetical protein